MQTGCLFSLREDVSVAVAEMAAWEMAGGRREVGEWRNCEGEEQVNSSELCSPLALVTMLGYGGGGVAWRDEALRLEATSRPMAAAAITGVEVAPGLMREVATLGDVANWDWRVATPAGGVCERRRPWMPMAAAAVNGWMACAVGLIPARWVGRGRAVSGRTDEVVMVGVTCAGKSNCGVPGVWMGEVVGRIPVMPMRAAPLVLLGGGMEGLPGRACMCKQENTHIKLHTCIYTYVTASVCMCVSYLHLYVLKTYRHTVEIYMYLHMYGIHFVPEISTVFSSSFRLQCMPQSPKIPGFFFFFCGSYGACTCTCSSAKITGYTVVIGS